MKNAKRDVRPGRSVGFTLKELVVSVATLAVAVGVLLPALSHAREASRPARCAANLKAIGQAYGLWAADNAGFLPPRCRDLSVSGCRMYNVAVGFEGFGQAVYEHRPYACSPSNGFGVVGNPPLATGGQAGSTYPSDYCRSDGFPLNRYVVPNWRVGTPFEFTRCPADIQSFVAPGQDCTPKAAPSGSIASCYDVWGTSYMTNILNILPWRGHGPWAMCVESSINRKVGPNYTPERIFKPARYILMLDSGSIYESWGAWLEMFDLGGKNDGARWHENSVGDPWLHANALFADMHVAFGQREVPATMLTLACVKHYVHAGWSLYPLKYTPNKSACKD